MGRGTVISMRLLWGLGGKGVPGLTFLLRITSFLSLTPPWDLGNAGAPPAHT